MAKKESVVPFEEALKNLLLWFKTVPAKGVVIGGVAASLLGQPRTTLDIDALVLMDISEWENFLNVGVKFGFLPRRKEALAFAKRNRVLLMQHQPSGTDIDISFGALPFEKETIKRSKHFKIGHLSIPLPTPEDLVIMKAVAHRTKDMMDIETILQAHPKMDLKRVLKWVKEFADFLEKPEIYDDLKKAIHRLRK